MKNMEINKKLGFKVVAVLTSASMILGGLAGCGKDASEDVAVVEQSAETDENDDLLSNVMNQVVHRSSTAGTEPRKDEVVYVMADAQGNTQKIIVSDCLKNANGESTIKDASSLTDIQNVKGNESYTVDENGNLVWNAEGSDIYYQGTSTKETPVSQTITYSLDGKEVKPEELAGKSGKVTIRFDYTNNETVKTKIGGKEEEIYVPFAAISGMVLDDSFSNVKVTNGKVISDGKNNIVVGYALPGLKESLDVDDSDFDGDVSIPDYVEVTADVENFSLSTTMTVVMNATNFISKDGDADLSEVDDMLDTLTDATDQLKDGSGELADGVDTLKSKMGEFKDGVGTLKNGIKDYTDGASTLSTGIGTLKSGVDTLAGSVPTLISGVGTLKDGSASAAKGASSLKDGAGTLKKGASDLATGAGQVADGATTLHKGASDLSDGLNTLDGGIGQLKEKAGSLATGAEQLKSGTDQLASGASTLVSNNEKLNDGAGTLSDGTDAIIDGVGELSDGAHKLADGITEFSEEGIDEIINSYNGDIEPLVDRIQAVLDAGADYQTYTDIADGVNGSVKFIIKTDAVKAED